MKTKDIVVGEEYYLRTRRYGSATRGRVLDIGVPRKGRHGFQAHKPVGIRIQILDKNGEPATARNSRMAEWSVITAPTNAQVPYIRVLLPQDVIRTWAEQLESEAMEKVVQAGYEERDRKAVAEKTEKNTPKIQTLREVGVDAELDVDGKIRIVDGKRTVYGNTHRSLDLAELTEVVISLAERLDAALWSRTR